MMAEREAARKRAKAMTSQQLYAREAALVASGVSYSGELSAVRDEILARLQANIPGLVNGKYMGTLRLSNRGGA